VACNDGSLCTTDSCSPALGCQYTAIGCDDGNACTADACDPATGCTHTAVACNDSNACTTDGCDPATGCTHTAVSCDDSDACTTDGCDPATGCTHTAVSCNDGDACTTDACDPTNGACTHVAVVCNDNNACTTDTCSASLGCQFKPVVCTGGDACNTPSCDPATGACTTTPVNCDDGDVCTADSCSLGTCSHTPIVCSDGTACTAANCAVTYTYVCDGVTCTKTSCFPAGTPVATPRGLAPIETLRPGDPVYAWDEATGEVTARGVSEVERRVARGLVRVRLADGSEITATDDHPFFVSGSGWVRGRELTAGDPLLTVDQRAERIRSVRPEPAAAGTVYNVLVDGAKTYFVGRTPVLVHSCQTTLNVVDWPGPTAAPVPAPIAGAEPLVVYASVLPGLGLVDAGAPDAAPRWLRCLDLPPWASRIGVHDDALAMLDARGHRVLLVPVSVLRAIAAGQRRCDVPEPGLVRTVELEDNAVPYEAQSQGDDLYVTYFTTNRLVRYRWVAPANGAGPALARVGSWQLASPSGKGASAVRVHGGTVFVADAGWSCTEANRCPTLYGESHLYAVDPARSPAAAVPPAAYPDVKNAAGLYVHPATGAVYVLAAGEVSQGESSLRRVVGSWALGPRLALPRNAKAFKAFSLDADYFAVVSMGGDHVFIVDARTDRLAAIRRFDGARFEPVALDTAAIPERTAADLQDLVPERGASRRFVLVDSKGEQVVRVSFDPRTLALTVHARVSLRGRDRHTTPSWALWLP